jgi:hypothetical protein
MESLGCVFRKDIQTHDWKTIGDIRFPNTIWVRHDFYFPGSWNIPKVIPIAGNSKCVRIQSW